MMFLAKVAGIAVLVWFYLTAKNNNQAAFQWAIIGEVGYWLTWWLIKLSVVAVLAPVFAKTFIGTFAVIQIPALCAIAAAFFIRKKLLADSAKKGNDTL